jgi:hypothetical protein
MKNRGQSGGQINAKNQLPKIKVADEVADKSCNYLSINKRHADS